MPTLSNYQQFNGLYWETGTVRNYLDYVGIKAPHTGKPYSEALLMGVSGGAVMGYFSFAYKGHDPHVALLSRNTFDPWDTMLARMGIVQTVQQTAKPEKGIANLLDALHDGVPAIVWADIFSLPYNPPPFLQGLWVMMPIVVYGYEHDQTGSDTVWIADRSRRPLQISTAQLAAARGKVKDHKHRLITLDLPDPDKLPSAVRMGIYDCIKLYTEKPPKGSKDNFGFAAYQRWAELLRKPTARMSWEKEFPAGSKLYAGLTSAYQQIMIFGKEEAFERPLYADFLDEAALILQNKALHPVAALFRKSGEAWNELAQRMLPNSIPLFQQARVLMWEEYQHFLNQGAAPIEAMQQRQARLQAIKLEVSEHFPLNAQEVMALREELAAQVMTIHDIELEAIDRLRQVMA